MDDTASLQRRLEGFGSIILVNLMNNGLLT